MVINIIMDDYINTIVRERKCTFLEWQDKEMYDLGGEIKYRDKSVKNQEYLQFFYNKIIKMIQRNGYVITNQKQLRNKIGTLIYKISE